MRYLQRFRSWRSYSGSQPGASGAMLREAVVPSVRIAGFDEFRSAAGLLPQDWRYHETRSSAVATVSGSSRSLNDCATAANERATLLSKIVRPRTETFTG